MSDINDELIRLAETKALIKDAINAQGVEVTSETSFRDYAAKIAQIGKPVIHMEGTEGYLYYPDTGYCEQWGTTDYVTTDGTYFEINLLKAYKDANYNIQLTPVGTNYAAKGMISDYPGYERTANKFWGYIENTDEHRARVGSTWRTCGILAEGEY